MARFKRLIKRLTVTEGQTEDVDFGRAEFLREVHFEFNGLLTAGAGTTDSALLEDGLLKTILKKIEFFADGRPHVDTTGQAEYFRRAIMSGSPGVIVSTMPTGAAATAQRVHVVVDFDALRSLARMAGRLHIPNLASESLRLTFGVAETDMTDGAGDRTDVLSGTVDVFAVFDDIPERFGGGRRIGNARWTNVGATTDARITLPSGLLISQLLFIAVDNGVRTTAVLTNVEVQLGEIERRIDQSFADLQSENVEEFGLELSAGSPPYAGLAILNWDKEGVMDPSKVLNTVGLRDNAARLILTLGAPTGVSYVDAFYYAVDPELGRPGRRIGRRAGQPLR